MIQENNALLCLLVPIFIEVTLKFLTGEALFTVFNIVNT